MVPGERITTLNGKYKNRPDWESRQDALRRCTVNWKTTSRKVWKVDINFKIILDTICTIAYMNCYQAAQASLNRDEKTFTVNLEADADDGDRSQLNRKSLDIIAEDSQYDRLSRNFRFMDNVISFKPNPYEHLNKFTITFNTVASLYTNHVGRFIPQMARQYVSIPFKNARMTKNSFKATILQ